jgi:hypothetical protein
LDCQSVKYLQSQQQIASGIISNTTQQPLCNNNNNTPLQRRNAWRLQEPKANLCATQTLADVATCSAVSKLTKHTLIAFLFFAVANGTL